jgi:hypothetical protein
MTEVKGYRYHYHKSREMFATWFCESRHNPSRDAYVQLLDIYGVEDLICQDDEFKYAMESYDETAEQVKLIHSTDHGHCLKIKWEHASWWPGDVLHHYYCVMLPIDQVNLIEPYDLQIQSQAIRT